MKIMQHHTVTGYVYIYDIPASDVNQKLNILMKTKIDIKFNRKSEIKSHLAFSSIT